VVAGQSGIEPFGRPQPGERPVDLADHHRPAQRGGRIVGERDQVVVPGQYLRPVGLLGGGSVIVEGGDRRLDLVLAPPIPGERGLRDADAVGDLAAVPPDAVLLVKGTSAPCSSVLAAGHRPARRWARPAG
jgi:hypothetical protein